MQVLPSLQIRKTRPSTSVIDDKQFLLQQYDPTQYSTSQGDSDKSSESFGDEEEEDLELDLSTPLEQKEAMLEYSPIITQQSLSSATFPPELFALPSTPPPQPGGPAPPPQAAGGPPPPSKAKPALFRKKVSASRIPPSKPSSPSPPSSSTYGKIPSIPPSKPSSSLPQYGRANVTGSYGKTSVKTPPVQSKASSPSALPSQSESTLRKSSRRQSLTNSDKVSDLPQDVEKQSVSLRKSRGSKLSFFKKKQKKSEPLEPSAEYSPDIPDKFVSKDSKNTTSNIFPESKMAYSEPVLDESLYAEEMPIYESSYTYSEPTLDESLYAEEMPIKAENIKSKISPEKEMKKKYKKRKMKKSVSENIEKKELEKKGKKRNYLSSKSKEKAPYDTADNISTKHDINASINDFGYSEGLQAEYDDYNDLPPILGDAMAYGQYDVDSKVNLVNLPYADEKTMEYGYDESDGLYGYSGERYSSNLTDNIGNLLGYGSSYGVFKETSEIITFDDESSSENIVEWNEMFQQAYDSLRSLNDDTPLERKMKVYRDVNSLSQNFSFTAEVIGKLIIAEYNLPNHLKTIKPVSIGGIVGGIKYIAHNILFKFAIDSSGLLESDESAMKIANHELKSLDNLLNCNVNNLHYPLLAIIDYRGYRLIAISVLPVSSKTLCFGSSDAGRTVNDSDPMLRDLISIACKQLNLKPHKVGSEGKIVPSPVDLEGHKGLDKRYYVLDFSRLFPPDLMSREHKCGMLFRLLRPELVKQYPTPLCSDTFSNFVKHYVDDAREHAYEVKDAHLYLTQQIIPAFGKMLSVQDANIFKVNHVIQSMHREGINLRYLGYVRGYLDPSAKSWRDIILIEMIARTVKWDLRNVLRQTTTNSILEVPSSFMHKKNIVTYLNAVFGGGESSVKHWEQIIIPSLLVRFKSALTPSELANIHTLRNYILSELSGQFFKRIDEICGIEFTIEVITEFSGSNASIFFANSEPFDEIHLKEFQPRVKQLTVVEQTHGLFLYTRSKRVNDEYFKKQMLKQSLSSFEKALECNPSDTISLLYCAKICARLKDDRARTFFDFAEQSTTSNSSVIFSYARFLHKIQDYEMAEKMYLQTLRQEPKHYRCLYYYSELLVETGDEKDDTLIKSLLAIILNSGPEKLKQKIHTHPTKISTIASQI